jgi:type IV secretory pathway VirB3-like protein
MSPMTFLGVAIVVAGIVLVLACAVALMAERPAAKRVSVRLWCPAASRLARVGLTMAVDRRLNVLSCERFPDGPVTCDQSCIPASAAA